MHHLGGDVSDVAVVMVITRRVPEKGKGQSSGRQKETYWRLLRADEWSQASAVAGRLLNWRARWEDEPAAWTLVYGEDA